MSTGGRVRSLVVDDYEPWRSFVRSKLENMPELQIVGEVRDGLKSVEHAKALQPDLILLDIGLPTINGIEAARRIREVCPLSKILFVTENRSPEIAEEALKTGANGYVVKSDAASELLPAIKAVLEGKRFISASLTGQFLIATTVGVLETTLLTSIMSFISKALTTIWLLSIVDFSVTTLVGSRVLS